MIGAIRNMRDGKVIRALRVVRLALSGAIVGSAAVGIFFPHAAGISIDAIGAGAGFTAVLLVKATHLI